jgi:transposase-like protein
MHKDAFREVLAAGLGGTEGGRRPTGVPPSPAAAVAEVGADGKGSTEAASRPDTQVLEQAVRRRFTAEYKLRTLGEADLCRQSGQLGALLRREGLYSSHLTSWRRQRDAGALAALKPRRRGRQPQPVHPLVAENETLRRQNERLAARLRQAETIIDVQKKSPRSWH